MMDRVTCANTDHATRNTHRLCVVGVGNPFASDDGVGPEVVRRLAAEYQSGSGRGVARDAPPVMFVTLEQAGVELIDLMDRCDALILIDAVSSGAPPGAIHREEWRPGALDSRGIERASSHGLGVREILSLANAMERLPARVVLWGIELASTEPGEGFSPAVAAALPSLVTHLQRELKTTSA